ncbi:MAG: hypothetical protein AAF798_19445 [Bacteroidota bacterium]
MSAKVVGKVLVGSKGINWIFMALAILIVGAWLKRSLFEALDKVNVEKKPQTQGDLLKNSYQNGWEKAFETHSVPYPKMRKVV